VTTYESYLVYPDGDTQEAAMPLRVNQLVDLNGYPLSLPLDNPRIIAYRVYKVTRREERGEDTTLYHLELVPVNELLGY
jgi:hypothetical protein